MQPPDRALQSAGTDPEVLLVGGRTTPGVVRVGDTVRRPTPANSAFLADLFALLASRGVEVAPRFLGRDDAGRLGMQWVEGVTTTHPCERREGAYAAGARLLRRLHDATAGTNLAGTAECVVHGDPGPFNTVFQGGMPVVFIDWDCAGPGSRLRDLAYFGWTWCVQSQGDVPVADQARRLALVLEAYGNLGIEALFAEIEVSMQAVVDLADDQMAGCGGDDAKRAHWQATRDWAAGDLALLAANRHVFERAAR